MIVGTKPTKTHILKSKKLHYSRTMCVNSILSDQLNYMYSIMITSNKDIKRPIARLVCNNMDIIDLVPNIEYTVEDLTDLTDLTDFWSSESKAVLHQITESSKIPGTISMIRLDRVILKPLDWKDDIMLCIKNKMYYREDIPMYFFGWSIKEKMIPEWIYVKLGCIYY